MPVGRPSFLNVPRCDSLDALDADVAVVAFPYTVPYTIEWSRQPSSWAPGAIREASLRYPDFLAHYDMDFGAELFAGRRVRIVDCGDVFEVAGQYEDNGRTATAVIKAILARGAVPVVLGGDHATTIPMMRAYDGRGPLCVVHIDAHLDWRDEVNGVHDGLSSPMRRASELPWVTSMIQIGLRAVGSARQREVDDAAAFGSIRVRAEELHEVGAPEILRRVPAAAAYYISLDTDAIDPAIAPGINALEFGGLTYFEVSNLLRGIAARGKIVGFDVVEIAPGKDHQNLTSL
ncbi:MAG TPA: arginase family protein, partial [Methylomirabilota bacterium]|nr:arginase family protein [Methylomirabilota bacterium]